MKQALAVAVLSTALFASPGAAPSPSFAGDEITDRSERAVERAITWMLRQQNKDGSWGLDARGVSGTCLTTTSLVAVALMSAGNHERGGPNRDCVEAVHRALEYVLEKARRKPADIAHGNNTLVQGKLGKRVDTFFSVVFLTQAYGMRGPWVPPENLEEMREILEQMADSIAKSQESDGSWHKEHFGALKATAMAWLALRSASSAGVDIRTATVDRVVNFMKKAHNPSTGQFDRTYGNQGYGGYQSIYSTASALRVLYGMGEGNSAEAKKGSDAFLKMVGKGGAMGSQFLTVEGEDYLCAALMTQSLMMEEGALWKKWFPFVRDELVKRQANDGTWTTTACISGKTFPTACAVMTLTTPYRLLPLYEH